jgi:hypothetical protein
MYSLGLNDQKSVALGIFMEVTWKFETVQENGILKSGSGFSEEDLPSNLIAFYVGVNEYTENEINDMCQTMSQENSLQVWDKTGGTRQNKSWQPVDHNNACACCKGQPLRWPKQLRTINAAPKGDLWRNWTYGVDWAIPNIPLRK